jgi:hypothetical protein
MKRSIYSAVALSHARLLHLLEENVIEEIIVIYRVLRV